MRRIGFVIATALLAGLPGAAQDPVKVSPEQYKVEMENEQVRVLRIKRPAHAKIPMHEHPAAVAVFLTDLHARVVGADGKVQEVVQKAGGTAFQPPVRHAEENISDKPFEAILVELKSRPSAAKAPPVALDPVKLDPKYHTVDFENERVRVLRTVMEPHVKSPLHEHPPYVVVYLTDLHTTMTLADGTVRDNPRKAGEVAWRDAMKHSTEQMGDRRAEEIQIELKSAPARAR